ncbi:MAG TPA: S16 family serine protease [archaeon]|nr:S16 family serine protease [archaeon]
MRAKPSPAQLPRAYARGGLLSLLGLVAAVLLASAAAGYFIAGPLLAPAFGPRARVPEPPRALDIPNSTEGIRPSWGGSWAWLSVPAVDSSGRGVVSTVTVQALPGSGRTLANIEDLLFWVDTQRSIQVAQAVAGNVTGKNLSNYDLIFTVEANAELVEGPSAGAAIALATIAALENRTLDTGVLITGTIEPDGSIGPVGGIREKAEAARLANATLFLVPLGQGTQPGEARRARQCDQRGSGDFCWVRYVVEAEPLDVGVEIREVADIQEALEYAW